MTLRPMLVAVLLFTAMGASAQPAAVTNARVVPSQVQPSTDATLDEIVERQHRQHGFEGAGRAHAVDPEQAPGHVNPREIRIDDRELVAVPHAAQRVQQIGMKKRVDPFEHGGLPVAQAQAFTTSR